MWKGREGPGGDGEKYAAVLGNETGTSGAACPQTLTLPCWEPAGGQLPKPSAAGRDGSRGSSPPWPGEQATSCPPSTPGQAPASTTPSALAACLTPPVPPLVSLALAQWGDALQPAWGWDFLLSPGGVCVCLGLCRVCALLCHHCH